MRKFLVLALTVATLAWAKPASASDPVLFDPTGGGGGVLSFTFDWKPGNSLLVEDVDPDTGATLGTGTVYFQANLGLVLSEGGGTLYTSGDGGDYFTAVAGYRVSISQGILFGAQISLFELTDLGGTNFFNIYHNTVEASNLTGLCFVCNDDPFGDPILTASATVTDADAFGSNFIVPNYAGQVPQQLDQNGVDNYPTVKTLAGQGSTDIQVTVTGFNAGYFPSLVVGTTFLTTNSDQIAPYDQADPSACFDSNGDFDGGGLDCDLLGATGVGAVNGTTSRIVVQTDANSSFIVPELEVVPEPTTLSLLGLGLLLGGAHLRRRAKKNS